MRVFICPLCSRPVDVSLHMTRHGALACYPCASRIDAIRTVPTYRVIAHAIRNSVKGR